MDNNRVRRIVRASFIGIVLNFLLVAAKVVVGLSSRSVSVLADALNNLMDSLSSIVTLVGVRLARTKPDKEHPHGHGRIEYIAAAIIGFIIFVVGVGAAFSSVPKIINPESPRYSDLGMIVIFVTIVGKLVYARYLKVVGRETKSRSLSASGVDAMFDAVLTGGTLVGAIVSRMFGLSIDGWIGLVIAVFIMRSAIEILSEGIGDVIGRRVDSRLVRKIKVEIYAVDGVKDITQIVLHDYGPEEVSGAIKIRVDERMTIKELKRITREIERRVFDELGVKLIVGV